MPDRLRAAAFSTLAGMEHVSYFLPRICERIANAPTRITARSAACWSRFLCLATSRKLGGFCVAGKLITSSGFGSWVRPVSAHGQGELRYDEIGLEGGGSARVADILEIPFGAEVPVGAQSENRAVSANLPWRHEGVASWETLQTLADSPATLWANGWHPFHDRLPASAARAFKYSLCLLHVAQVRLRFLRDARDRVKARALFDHMGVRYSLCVTDPAVAALAERHSGQECMVDDTLLCLSLTQPFQGYCYKLVSAVITRGRIERRWSCGRFH